MKAVEAKARYDLTLVKEDNWYYYIKVLPRFPQDKADFQEARLVLNKSSYLPRDLWFKQPNGDEVRWDIPKIDSNVRLNQNDFLQPPIPQGWKLERVARGNDLTPSAGNTRPRIVRPNQ
jgi:hypothetical protein